MAVPYLLYTATVDDTAFEKLVSEGFGRLPQWVRDKISNVAVLIEDEPSDELRKLEGLTAHETLLGHYHGIPLTARGEGYGGLVLPDTITIFKEPILDAAEEECPQDAPDSEYLEHVRRIVSETVWHEFAHHFGMDEHEVREREDKRDHGI
jgi:predicted Zn-dependent protease with MMP-like domain